MIRKTTKKLEFKSEGFHCTRRGWSGQEDWNWVQYRPKRRFYNADKDQKVDGTWWVEESKRPNEN